MFETQFVAFGPAPGSLDLVNAPILVDQEDFEGIHIAAECLSKDFEAVTGTARNPLPKNAANLGSAPSAIIIGSLTKSPTIQALVAAAKLDVSPISGAWESYITTLVDKPVDGCDRALVIAGSDKRAAIFGLYTLSSQIGVSPWHFWSDVTPKRHPQVFAIDVSTREGPPTVKYRGLFINDEAPALAGWVHEKLGPVFGVEFYKHVFELLLRLKANFMWPAMWFGYPDPGQSFFADDPLNQETADKYGIVVSTSHHEPMQRAANEWFSTPYHEPDGSWSWLTNKSKITQFFAEGAERAKPYESYITMGMRGQGDRKIEGSDPLQVLREVLATQRSILERTYSKPDGVCQLIALYKEVQQQYSAGLSIPDDITLLFSDDNYGAARRLPIGDEKKRSGGAGIYYHFEYVGHPRSYTWLNSNHLPKVWQQLDHVYKSGAKQIWIFNVGDLKPMEIPFTFAMTLAWDINRLPLTRLETFFDTFVEDTFDIEPSVARECSQLLRGYDRLIALRKHDHTEADTFSLLNYDEAAGIANEWAGLSARAERLHDIWEGKTQPAFFQLVLHPIKATSIFISLRVAQAKNRMYGLQRRNAANTWAKEVLRLFDADFDLSQEYHALLGGKWNHIVRQPHLGYREIDFAPSRDMIDGVCYVQTRQNSNPIAGNLGITVEGHMGVRPGLCCEEADRTHPTRRDLVPGLTVPPLEPYGPNERWFEIYSRGTEKFDWTLKCPSSWVRVSEQSGHTAPADEAHRIQVSIDWETAPQDLHSEVLIEVRTSIGDFDYIHVPVINRDIPRDFSGFVESDRHVSMNATKFSRADEDSYTLLPFLGRTSDGAVAPRHNASEHRSTYLEYSFYTFTTATDATVGLQFTFTLDTDPSSPLSYSIGIDDDTETTHRLVSEPQVVGELPPDWLATVMDCVWTRKHPVNLECAGAHTLRIRLNGSNCVLEKIVIDLGGVRESYLGPPQSRCV